MREIIIGIVVFVCMLALVFGITFASGFFNVKYTETIGKQQANADREVFKQSQPYVEGMIADLAKYQFEIIQEKNVIAKKAIAEMIIQKYSNFDITLIKDRSLAMFLESIRNGTYLEDTNGKIN